MAPSAILELIDGPTDIRFAMTARTLVKERDRDQEPTDITAKNIAKVTRFRPGGAGALEEMVEKVRRMTLIKTRNNAESSERRWGGGV
jgi:large subunit ribosomal protein L17